jgi:CheY-like chemotaxis protein
MEMIRGKRVLVAEDEPLLTMNLEDILADLGCHVAGTAARLEQALALATKAEFDVAILDINLDGQSIDPVAAAVHHRGLPMVFVTGYNSKSAAQRSLGHVVEKPYDAEQIRTALGKVFGQASA